MAVISKLSQGTKDSCIAGDGWTSSPGAQNDVGEGDGGMAEEEDKEMVLDKDGEDRRYDSQEPGEIIEEYGMEPGHSGAGTMDVPSRPPLLSLCLARYTANRSTPLPPLNTNDSAMSEQSISLNSLKHFLPQSFGASSGPTSYFPASSYQSNQDPMHESPISSGAQSPVTTESPSIQALNLFGEMEFGSSETSPMMSVFSAHMKKASGVGKEKQPMSSKGTHTHTSTSPVNLQGSSGSHKRSHGLTTSISTKITDTSDVLLRHIQEGAGTKVEVKCLKYEANHQYRELKACEQHGECEHELWVIMENNQHSIAMATSENNRLKLELELERLRIRRLELELTQGSSSTGTSAAGSPHE